MTYQDLNQNFTQTGNDLFPELEDNDFADFDAGSIEQEAAALGSAPIGVSGLQEDTVQAVMENGNPLEGLLQETMADHPIVQENNTSAPSMEIESLQNETEQNHLEEIPVDTVADSHAGTADSKDKAIITVGMNITGDVKSSGDMNLIGSITGNIEISGRLDVTGSITGNSSAAEIYAESAQINGEVRSQNSVTIGQGTRVIGNIFAASAVIAGAVKGDIDVQGHIVLDTSAVVLGNIKSKSVEISKGAVVDGMCSQCYADVTPAAFFDEVEKDRQGDSTL